MTNPEGMQSLEDIQRIFETNRVFAEETVAESLGRFAWLSTRLQAEFTLTLIELGIEESKIPAIMEAFGECQEDFYDFVRIGLEMTRETPREVHPQEDALDDATEELLDTIDIVQGKEISESHLFKGGNKEMLDYGEMSEEDLFHRINGHIQRLQSGSSE